MTIDKYFFKRFSFCSGRTQTFDAQRQSGSYLPPLNPSFKVEKRATINYETPEPIGCPLLSSVQDTDEFELKKM